MKAKIFISYHDEHYLIKSDILQPIQTGCDNAAKLFDGMLKDNMGENISAANDRYCELTAQYWAWKNYDTIGAPDYVGFMHYRRHFIFDGWQGNPEWCWLPKGNVYFVPFIAPTYLQHITDDRIKEQLEDCDCLVLKPYDVKKLQSKDIRTQYAKLPKQNPQVFDIFIKTAKKLYPDYIPDITKIEKGSVQYLCNMFVMKKELFFRYNEFCFSILQEVDKQVDSSKMDDIAARFLGYLGEFCLSIFIFHLFREKKYKIKELNGSYILSDDVILHPLWKFFCYYVLSKLTFGDVSKHYRQKRKLLKNILKCG